MDEDAMVPNATVSLATYLFTRLRQLGVDSLHGVPGDFNLIALDYVESSGLHWVGDSAELNAGYAADGYARVKGMGALITTFGVGELSAVNAVAGSYAEYVPVVHIVGTPATSAQKSGLLLHHTLGNGDFRVYAEIYKRITCDQANLDDIRTSPTKIDSILRQCWIQSRPVYIELPSDIVHLHVDATPLSTPLDTTFPVNEPEAESVAVEEILSRMYAAQQPCVLVDGCVLRRHVRGDVDEFLRKTRLPVFVSPMGKSAVDESLSNFCGVYAGDGSFDTVRGYVEKSDCVLTIGTIKSDFNTTGFTYRISTLNSIELHTGVVQIGYGSYSLQMKGVIRALTSRVEPDRLHRIPYVGNTTRKAASGLNTRQYLPSTITQDYLWPQVSHWLRPGDIVLTETGTSYIGIWDTKFPSDVIAISQPLWSSIGFTLPAAQGAAQAARDLGKGQRVILFEGDGSFQMTAQSIGTMIRNNLDLVIFLINNDGYTIERWIHGMDEKYNDIGGWKYSQIPEAMGGKVLKDFTANSVDTKEQLDKLWASGHLDSPKGLHFVEVFMPKEDAPVTLRMITSNAEKMNAG